MAPPVQLDQIVMALSCLLSATEFNQTPISLNSKLVYQADNMPMMNCQYEAINEFVGLEEKIKDLNQLQAKYVDNLEREIVEMRKYISDIVTQRNDKKDPYCDGIENGVATIKVNAITEPLEITCESNRYGKNWMIVLNKNAKSNFPINYKTLTGYKISDGNYFIGVETLRALSLERKHEALIIWEDKHNMENFLYVPSAAIGEDYRLNLQNINTPLLKNVNKADIDFVGNTMKILIKPIAALDE